MNPEFYLIFCMRIMTNFQWNWWIPRPYTPEEIFQRKVSALSRWGWCLWYHWDCCYLALSSPFLCLGSIQIWCFTLCFPDFFIAHSSWTQNLLCSFAHLISRFRFVLEFQISFTFFVSLLFRLGTFLAIFWYALMKELKLVMGFNILFYLTKSCFAFSKTQI